MVVTLLLPRAKRSFTRLAAGAAAAAMLVACDDRPAVAPSAIASGAAASVAAAGTASSCAACHGARGEGSHAAGFPRLAGQPRVFLRYQLDSFADGTRSSPFMQPVAHALSPDERASAAGRYAAQVAPAAASPPEAPAEVLQRGRHVAEQGDAARQIQPCRNCHGEQGEGVGMQLPYLAGQPAAYLVRAMAAYRDSARRDPTGQMTQIAQLLGEQDAKAVAAYYAGLPPPAQPLDVSPLPGAASPAGR